RKACAAGPRAAPSAHAVWSRRSRDSRTADRPPSARRPGRAQTALPSVPWSALQLDCVACVGHALDVLERCTAQELGEHELAVPDAEDRKLRDDDVHGFAGGERERALPDKL